MKRTLVIGDIHGGFKAVKQVLKRANVTENDKLISLEIMLMAGVNLPKSFNFTRTFQKTGMYFH